MATEKKLILISSGNNELDQALQAYATGIWKDSVVFFAGDGNQVMLKAEKAPPHLFILTASLPKINGIELFERLKNEKTLKKSAFIVMLDPNQKIVMSDDAALGRAHFIHDRGEGNELQAALTNALNYVNEGAKESPGYKSRFIKKGDILIRHGAQADSVFILVKGKLTASITNDKNQKTILGSIEPGEFVGEMSYINKEARVADVHAELDSELLEIGIDSMDTLLYQKPAWAKAMIKTLSRRLKGANKP